MAEAYLQRSQIVQTFMAEGMVYNLLAAALSASAPLIVGGAVVGGVMAVGFVVRRVVFKPKTPGYLPYGVAIAVGGLWVLALNYLPVGAIAAQVA